MTTTKTEDIEGLSNLDKAIEKFGNSMIGTMERFHKNHSGNSLSYIEDDTDMIEPIVKGMVPLTRVRGNRYSAGVKRYLKSIGYKSGFQGGMTEYLRLLARNDNEFKVKHKAAMDVLRKANAINTMDDESAGALVLPEFSPSITSVMYDNDILGQTDQYTIGGNSMTFPKVNPDRRDGKREGGIVSYWLEEGDLMTSSRPAIDGTSLKLKKVCVVVFVTEEMLDDNAYMLEQWVKRAVQEELKFILGDAIFNGIGGKRPTGILTSESTVVVAKEAGQLANTIVAQNIEKMFSRGRIAQGLEGYKWYANQEALPQLSSMTVGTGASAAPVWLPGGNLAGAPFGTLKGLPLQITEFNSALGTQGDLAFADLSKYVTINKGGIQEAASMHVEFLRQQVAFRFTMRIDGRPMYDLPTNPAKGSATVSDFVTLETRA